MQASGSNPGDAVVFSADDVRSLGLDLMSPLGLSRWVSEPAPGATPATPWPFTVERHPAAAGPLAQAMTTRLQVIEVHKRCTFSDFNPGRGSGLI